MQIQQQYKPSGHISNLAFRTIVPGLWQSDEREEPYLAFELRQYLSYKYAFDQDHMLELTQNDRWVNQPSSIHAFPIPPLYIIFEMTDTNLFLKGFVVDRWPDPPVENEEWIPWDFWMDYARVEGFAVEATAVRDVSWGELKGRLPFGNLP